jgi:hypothetical protein
VGFVDPNGPGIYPVCPSLTLFGVYCPLCGGLRGAHALATGDLSAMFSSNLLLPLLVVASAWAWLSWTSARLGRRLLPPVRVSSRAWVVGTVLAVVYGVLRNLPVQPFTFLAP